MYNHLFCCPFFCFSILRDCSKMVLVDLDIPLETVADLVVRIGLYVGALFQVTCMIAIILLPDNPTTDSSGCNGKSAELSDQEAWDSQSSASSRQSAHRMRKPDKKKRR